MIKKAFFGVMVAVILFSILLFQVSAEDPTTTTKQNTTTAKTTAEPTTEDNTTVETTTDYTDNTDQITTTKKTTVQETTKKVTSSNNNNDDDDTDNDRYTTTHKPVTYYLDGQEYIEPTTDANGVTVATTASKTGGKLGANYWGYANKPIIAIILSVLALIIFNLYMHKRANKIEDDGDVIYSNSSKKPKKRKPVNRNRIK